jgi:hypothetical protein
VPSGDDRWDDNRRWRIIGALVIAALNVADLITTYLILARVPDAEMNGWISAMVADRRIIPVKAAVCIGLLVVAFRLRRPVAMDVAIVWLLAGIYLSVALVNTWTLTQL